MQRLADPAVTLEKQLQLHLAKQLHLALIISNVLDESQLIY